MKLIEKYSLETGLKIGEQFLLEKFYPISVDKFITFHTSSGQPAKNYPYYVEVIELVSKILEKHGVSIIQLGTKEEQILPNCINLNGQTSIHQTNYILRKSILHVGNDSWLVHRAGELNVPVVVPYGSTTSQNHGPYMFNPKSIFLDSHRMGKNPSFSAQEPIQTVAFVPPEVIANSIFKILGIDHKYDIQSLFFGLFYNAQYFEIIPNNLLDQSVNVFNPVILRMDYEFNEQYFISNLSIRKSIVVTDKEINLDILNQLKPNIMLMKVDINNVTPNWIKMLKRIGLNINFYSEEKDEQKITQKRLDLFDSCLFEQAIFPTAENLKAGIETYINKKIDKPLDFSNMKFKTNKFIISNNKIFLSKAHLDSNIFTNSIQENHGNVIDSKEFWKDQNHFYFYYKQSTL